MTANMIRCARRTTMLLLEGLHALYFPRQHLQIDSVAVNDFECQGCSGAEMVSSESDGVPAAACGILVLRSFPRDTSVSELASAVLRAVALVADLDATNRV